MQQDRPNSSDLHSEYSLENQIASVQVYASTMQQQVLTQVLASITRIVYFSNVEALR